MFVTVLLTLACSVPPPPPEASSTIPLDGQVQLVNAVDSHKYLHYAVGRSIEAPPELVWALLTDAKGYTGWNSTVVSLDGDISAGSTIHLVVKAAPDRTFDLNVSTFEAPSLMVWSDGGKTFRGVRTFTLSPNSGGGTDWTMKEAFDGTMIGMIAPKLPDFTEDFETFARDLEVEAEKRAAAARPPEPAPEAAPEAAPSGG